MVKVTFLFSCGKLFENSVASVSRKWEVGENSRCMRLIGSIDFVNCGNFRGASSFRSFLRKGKHCEFLPFFQGSYNGFLDSGLVSVSLSTGHVFRPRKVPKRECATIQGELYFPPVLKV